jgi:hypothetical protein
VEDRRQVGISEEGSGGRWLGIGVRGGPGESRSRISSSFHSATTPSCLDLLLPPRTPADTPDPPRLRRRQRDDPPKCPSGQRDLIATATDIDTPHHLYPYLLPLAAHHIIFNPLPSSATIDTYPPRTGCITPSSRPYLTPRRLRRHRTSGPSPISCVVLTNFPIPPLLLLFCCF